MDLNSAMNTKVSWNESAPPYAYEATVDGQQWRLRLNDFPEEQLYTLFVGKSEIGELDDFPPAWSK